MAHIEIDLPNSILKALDERSSGTGNSREHLISAAISEYLGERFHTVFQVSTSGALVAGVYDREVSIEKLLEHGDFGLGTFAGLDGEMVVLDGIAYQVHGSGKVDVAAPDAGAPFGIVTWFQPDATVSCAAISDIAALTTACDQYRKSDNIFYAIKLEAMFDHITTRAVKPPREGVGLAEASNDEATFSFDNIAGTLVGIWSPGFSGEFSIAGYHFHFISKDRQHGGHVLDVAAGALEIQLNALTQFHLALPETERFLKADLSKSCSDDLAYAEGAHKEKA